VRIRHYGLLANRTRQAKLARARQLLAVVAATPLLSPVSVSATDPAPSPTAAAPCPGRTRHGGEVQRFQVAGLVVRRIGIRDVLVR